MNETAYRTADPEVLAAWTKYEAETEATRATRREVEESVGRRMYVRRNGFGHGDHVVGFERFDSDKDGDTLHHDKCLIVSTKRGPHNGLVVPNLRRKAGKAFDAELRALTTDGPDLPGMPSFHIGGAGGLGMMSHTPALWEWENVIYAFWGCDDAPVKDNWESLPLSTYHLAREQKEQANANQG